MSRSGQAIAGVMYQKRFRSQSRTARQLEAASALPTFIMKKDNFLFNFFHSNKQKLLLPGSQQGSQLGNFFNSFEMVKKACRTTDMYISIRERALITGNLEKLHPLPPCHVAVLFQSSVLTCEPEKLLGQNHDR